MLRNKKEFCFFFGGGGCPRTTWHKSEILQSVSSSSGLCFPTGNNGFFSGTQASESSKDTYKLKVENLKNGVLGQPGGLIV